MYVMLSIVKLASAAKPAKGGEVRARTTPRLADRAISIVVIGFGICTRMHAIPAIFFPTQKSLYRARFGGCLRNGNTSKPKRNGSSLHDRFAGKAQANCWIAIEHASSMKAEHDNRGYITTPIALAPCFSARAPLHAFEAARPRSIECRLTNRVMRNGNAEHGIFRLLHVLRVQPRPIALSLA